MSYLITGRAGSGKSTICHNLQRHGYEAYDGDELPGLAGWIDLASGQPAIVDHTRYVDYTKVSWNWNAAVLQRFLDEYPQGFLCGSASNQLTFHQEFTKVFVLDLDPRAHRQRLETRQSTYAKDEQQIREILQEQSELVRDAQHLGATLIDGTQSIARIINEIVEYTHDH